MRLGLPLLFGALLIGHAAAEPTTLASDLTEPTAIAYVPGPAGGFRLLVAEAGGRLAEFTILGGRVLSRRAIDAGLDPPIGAPVVGVGWYEGHAVVLTPTGGTAVDQSANDPDAPKPLTSSDEAADSGPWAGPPALSERWLFLPARDGILRGRLASGRVMSLRRLGPAVLAVAVTPAGYLATLDAAAAGEDGCRLSYRDPEEPAEPIASYPIEGLSAPVALAVRTTDSTLYALTRGDAPRLFRLDAAAADTPGPIRAVATPIDAPDGITAMAFGPAGELLATTRSGTLVRVDSGL